MSSAPPSVEELREESERSRHALASTVGELRDTVGNTASELKTIISPANIKKELRSYVREERESLVDSLRRQAKDNPLQMAAVGAAVAYPAWSLLRAIPTPLLLVGAGLFLTSKRGQQSTNEIRAKVEDVLQQGSEKVSDLADSVRSDLEDRIAGARYGAEDLRDTVTSSASEAAGRIKSVVRDAAVTAKGAINSTKGALNSVVGQSASAASNAACESAGTEKDPAIAVGTRSQDALSSFVTDNPLLVAGIGAAIGAFIAASMPSSDAENKLFGAGSEKLKEKAREAAAQGIRKAGDIAAEAAGAVATAAAREGLDAAGVKQALNSAADSVRKVADRGLETALGTTPSGQPPNTQRNAI
jgi:ElaB/YqjD/DUF883 family membrane-anchored ribosome-binding protein